MLNHSLFEVCAKIGGQPWAIDELPHFYETTMCIGYHVSHETLSFVSTFNSKCNRYWSKCLSLRTKLTDDSKLKQDML